MKGENELRIFGVTLEKLRLTAAFSSIELNRRMNIAIVR